MRMVGGLFRLPNYQLIASYKSIVFTLFFFYRIPSIVAFFLSYAICLNAVMSLFPTLIQPTSGHHRQGKLEGNFHIKDIGLACF